MSRALVAIAVGGAVIGALAVVLPVTLVVAAINAEHRR